LPLGIPKRNASHISGYTTFAFHLTVIS